MTVPASDRQAIYRRLARRNRLVGVLRLALPALGLVLLAALSAQIYLSSLGARFGIGQLTVTPETIAVDAPEYAGLLDDGSSYRVWATQARAATARTELIDLAEAALEVTRPDGLRTNIEAARAQLDTMSQEVFVPGVAAIEDSAGTVGTLADSVFDWSAQVLTSSGPVAIDYADGATVRAQGLVYDAKTMVWTFSRALVTLPDTPGAATPLSDTSGDPAQ